MPDLLLPRALLPSGWASDVLVSIDDAGSIADVRSGAPDGDAERVDGVAVPGVPNVHSHAFQRAMAGLAERGSGSGDTFWSWRERMYGFLERLGPEDVEAIAAQLFVEMLRHGYTSVAEFHYLRNDPAGAAYGDPAETARRILAAAAATGIAVTILPTLYRSSDFGGAPPVAGQRRFVADVDALLSDVEALRASAADDPNVRVGLALHSLRAVPPDDLGAALTGLSGIDPAAPVHIHVAEQLREVEACVAWCGRRPVEWLLDHAQVDARWCLVHATHLTDGETSAVADSGAVAGLCPTTEANLGDGVFRFAEYLAAGGRWAIGSDSNVSASPVAELRAIEYAQRLVRRERNVAAAASARSTGRTLLDAAWAGGAQACGRSTGRIEAGARADLVVLDPDHPALVGREDDELLDAWVFSGDDNPVSDVMVGGAWVVADAKHERQDEVLTRYRAVARSLAD